MKFLNRFKKPKVTFWTKEVGLTDIAPIKEHIKFIPDWYRRMRTYVYSDSKDKEVERKAKEIFLDPTIPSWKKTDNKELATVRKCPALKDWFRTGYVIPLWTDVDLEREGNEGKVNTPTDRFTIERHQDDQLLSHLTDKEREASGIQNVWKFMCPWRLKTPPGYSVYQVPMMWDFQHHDKFSVLPGIIDTDIHHEINQQVVVYKQGLIKLKRGMPLVMYIPFKRENYDFEVVNETPELAKDDQKDVLNIFSKFPGKSKVSAYEEQQLKCPVNKINKEIKF